ncbi:histidinol-phosphate transaminase [Flavobacterium cerinum]|uniref:Histidinol-phosphate aminotransferase n=1 Tax=Flavobacterium cerinum TaxID=2502784 RepID=A0ABY5INW6_9FLAO|nr:histidinol-phosphate transaminase [Flavobacterium cerinum]UUC44532.1 histidinol-phosphate transaminase [Flavobacterium cerinum]
MKLMEIKDLVRKNILEMKPYSSARDEFYKANNEMIFLDANENPFENGLNRYPDSKQLALKLKIARQKGTTVEQITLGNGSDEILDLVFRVFCNPEKDNIVTLPPTYGMYGVLADLNGIENREVLLNCDFQLDIPKIMERIDANTKLIFICSPNNPTGNLICTEAIILLLKSFNGIVVIDEAYIDFAAQESWLKRGNEFPNLIVIQTFSKAYGMAGIRLGMAFASPFITSLLHKIKPPYNISTLTVNKGIDQQESKNEIALIKREKESLIKVLLKVDFVKKVYPSDANFVLIKVDNAVLRYNQLLENGIVVRNRSNYPNCKNCLRITIGTEAENQVLITVLNTIKKRES